MITNVSKNIDPKVICLYILYNIIDNTSFRKRIFNFIF